MLFKYTTKWSTGTFESTFLEWITYGYMEIYYCALIIFIIALFNFVTSINTCGMFIFVNWVFVISNFSIVKTQSLPAVFSLIYIMLFDPYVTVLFSTIHWFSRTCSKWLRMVAMGEIINMIFTVQRPWYQLLKNLTSLNFQTCLFFQKLDSY